MPDAAPQSPPPGAVPLSPADLQSLTSKPPMFNGLPIVPAKPSTDVGPTGELGGETLYIRLLAPTEAPFEGPATFEGYWNPATQ